MGESKNKYDEYKTCKCVLKTEIITHDQSSVKLPLIQQLPAQIPIVHRLGVQTRYAKQMSTTCKLFLQRTTNNEVCEPLII